MFQTQGYTIFKRLIPPQVTQKLKEGIEKETQKCAQEIGYSKEDYLSVVNRWMAPSSITGCVDRESVAMVKRHFSEWMGEEVLLHETHIICKNAYSAGAVPFHQDISYSPQNPYAFSTWIALDDVSESDGPLSVVPGSHLEGISPAIDFWSPHFKPAQRKSIPLPVEKGDMVCFDSRLWHGSPPSQTRSSRYAWVQRWSTKSWKLKEKIPPPQSLPFGMWTCGEEIRKYLSKGIKNPPESLIDLIDLCSEKHPLEKLKILHLADRKHNGGDATGTICKELWPYFKSQEKYS